MLRGFGDAVCRPGGIPDIRQLGAQRSRRQDKGQRLGPRAHPEDAACTDYPEQCSFRQTRGSSAGAVPKSPLRQAAQVQAQVAIT